MIKLPLDELEAVIKYLFYTGQLTGLLYEEIVELLKTRGFEVEYDDVVLLYEPELMEEFEIMAKKEKYTFNEETGEFFDEEFQDSVELLGEFSSIEIEEEDFDY